MKDLIMLPNHPEFQFWLAQPPPNWKESYAKNEYPVLAITPNSSIPIFVTSKELDELIFDAELYGDDLEGNEEESLCYYPETLHDPICL